MGKQQRSRAPRNHGSKPGRNRNGRPRRDRPAEPTFDQSGPVEGVLDIGENGRAYLRSLQRHLVPRESDPPVDRELISRLGLRGGEMLVGTTGPSKNRNQRGTSVNEITTVNAVAVSEWQAPEPLNDTVAIDPQPIIHLDTKGGPTSMRIVELFAPIGFGQRGLIVAPPRTGKTMLLQQMAHGIAVNHPEAYVIVLLIDERPEEVTDMRRNVRGEVVASSNDLDVDSHIRVARLTIERARRLTELGQNIIILLDSITRLGRAFNSFVKGSGRTMTGGLDIRALQEPKQIFGSARNIEGGGSLTIIATALIDTGSRADEFIFQEFKGTGNMELVLDRDVANQRIWPAIDLQQSGTRKEEKLLDEESLGKQHILRRQMTREPPARQMTALLERMDKHDSLQSFLDSLRG
jgi:transcription termination factor Rho